jgi:outer membrane lipoprotein-sorting protein
MPRIAFFIFLFIFSPMSAGMAMADPEAEILARISRAQQEIISVQAEFEQLKISDVFAEPLSSGGWMFFARPDFLRWQYTYPDNSGIMLDNNQVFAVKLNSDHSEQTVKADSSASRLINYIMEWVNFDLAVLPAKYNLSLLSQMPATVLLQVRDPGLGKFIRSITIEFDPGNMAARQVTLLEPDGDQTVITFTKVLVNRQVAGPLSAPCFNPHPAPSAE